MFNRNVKTRLMTHLLDNVAFLKNSVFSILESVLPFNAKGYFLKISNIMNPIVNGINLSLEGETPCRS